MNLHHESAEPVDHASIEAGDMIGCVLTLTGGDWAWTGPFTVVANDREADVIAVQRHDFDRVVPSSSVETFVEGDDLVRWLDALDGAARMTGRICACDGPHRSGCTA